MPKKSQTAKLAPLSETDNQPGLKSAARIATRTKPTAPIEEPPREIVKPAKAVAKLPHPANGGSKIDAVINLLRAKGGASIDQVSKVTGWQAHSIRGAISGHLKKKLGLNVLSEKIDGTRRYRIAR